MDCLTSVLQRRLVPTAQVLAEQVVGNPAVPRWLLKIDDEHLGRGHAYMDVAAVPGIATVLQEQQASIAAATGWFTSPQPCLSDLP